MYFNILVAMQTLHITNIMYTTSEYTSGIPELLLNSLSIKIKLRGLKPPDFRERESNSSNVYAGTQN